jgi:spore coat protein A, manganese oxidase
MSKTTVKGQNSGFGSYFKRNWLTATVIALVSVGAMGALLKYLEQDANRVKIERSKSTPLNPANEGLLAKVNPFLSAPTPTPTPQLSKENIYAGSRLLTVEDANANAAPPADLAVWRPSTGTWWVMGPNGNVQASFGWGSTGDKAMPGDYDGDGKTDFSVYRPATAGTSAVWWIMKSSTLDTSYYSVPFGAVGDIPAAADFDGDGKTDVAIYRAGVWYIQQSSDGAVSYPQFGLGTDLPTPKDFDGDGKADLAVWRDTNTTFYSSNSSNGQLQTVNLSTTSSKPVPADYDGDGKADYAIRNSNNWIIRNSSNNQAQTIPWQQSGDIEIQNDYDGDGRVDIAVWHEENGTWLIRQSSKVGQTEELRQAQWGIAGDRPVPAFYRR